MDFIKRHKEAQEAGHWVSGDLSNAIDIITKQTVEIEKLRYDLKIADAAYDEVTEKYSELVTDTNYEIVNLENQLHQLKPFRDLVYHIASKRQDSVDDYIRLAKQAIADYESVLK